MRVRINFKHPYFNPAILVSYSIQDLIQIQKKQGYINVKPVENRDFDYMEVETPTGWFFRKEHLITCENNEEGLIKRLL